MNKMLKRLLFVICGLLLNAFAFAQGTPETENLMRSNGKIYVVVAVCVTILTGLFIYVFLLDRKISRFEKNKE